MKCAFCSAKTGHCCNWPVEKPTGISHWELDESHIVVTNQAKRHLRPLVVRRFNVSSEMCQLPGWGPNCWGGVQIPVTMYALRFPDDRYFLYYLHGRDRVQVLNPAECGNACCEAHLQERSDKTRYCMAHWGAWQHVDVEQLAAGATA